MAFFITLYWELNLRKEIAHSAAGAATYTLSGRGCPSSIALRRVERAERVEQRACAEADDVVKPVAHKLNRLEPVCCNAFLGHSCLMSPLLVIGEFQAGQKKAN